MLPNAASATNVRQVFSLLLRAMLVVVLVAVFMSSVVRTEVAFGDPLGDLLPNHNSILHRIAIVHSPEDAGVYDLFDQIVRVVERARCSNGGASQGDMDSLSSEK